MPLFAEGHTKVYSHTQAVANTTWSINHNFGEKYVIAYAYDTLNNRIDGKTVLVDTNNCNIVFDEPIDGYALIIH